MKFEGVFKDDWTFISLDKDSSEKFSDKVDVKAFEKIKKCRLKRK